MILQVKPQSLRLQQFPILGDSQARVSSSLIVRMSATGYSGISLETIAVKPPSHPTYDLKGVIKLALAEDAADGGKVTCFPFPLVPISMGLLILIFM